MCHRQQAHLQGRKHGFAARNTPDQPPPEELWQSQRQLDAWLIKWSDEVSEESLAERVTFKFVGGGQGVMTREQMLLHVVNHTTCHRGYIADLFYQIPARVPTTDLPVFLRDVPQDSI